MKTHRSQWRNKLYVIIFGTQTRTGRIFDIVLIFCILVSILVVILETIPSIHSSYGGFLRSLEWGFTIIFTIEYGLRMVSTPRLSRYLFSFFGIVDFLSVIPTYLGLFLVGSEYFFIIRILRVLRIFRVLKLNQFLGSAEELNIAMRQNYPKIIVFLSVIFSITILMGTFMYAIEGPENGFTNIPAGIYWAIVTITTVGFGDIVPHTFLGKLIASVLMIMGYGLIAVPTGIISASVARSNPTRPLRLICLDCGTDLHAPDARYCRICGGSIASSKDRETKRK